MRAPEWRKRKVYWNIRIYAPKVNILAGKLTSMAFSCTVFFMKLTEDDADPIVDGIVGGAEYIEFTKDSEVTLFI